MVAAPVTTPEPAPSDEEIVRRVLGGNAAMFEILMRRYNQVVYRAARAILREDTEAEDVMQEAYVRAYQHLDQFAGRAKFSTWICRIAINEALARQQRRAFYQESRPMSDEQDRALDQCVSPEPTPEQQFSAAETRLLLERAIDALPDIYRAVFVLRDVEDMETEAVATALGISADSVKTRLHRARVLLRKFLYSKIGASSREAFAFHATRCDRVVWNVFRRLAGIAR